MPIYEFACEKCRITFEEVCAVGEGAECKLCGSLAIRLLSPASIVIAGNIGPKLRNRVELSDELERQGFSAPLFKDDLHKDMSRWALNKTGAFK